MVRGVPAQLFHLLVRELHPRHGPRIRTVYPAIVSLGRVGSSSLTRPFCFPSSTFEI